MRNTIVILSAAVGLASHAWAGPCAATTYNNYKAGGFTCTVGPLTFSNFGSTFTNAHDLSNTPITDNTVDVTIINAGGFFGLDFALGAAMAVRDDGSGPQEGRAQFTFTVSGAPILAAKIGLSGARNGNGTNATFNANVSGTTLSTNVATGPTTDTQPIPGAPNSVNVSDDARATIPGGNLQSAQIQSIQNSFQAAPEPGTVACLGAGFLVLLAARRRVR